jgi:hypothetical protein
VREGGEGRFFRPPFVKTTEWHGRINRVYRMERDGELIREVVIEYGF